MQPSHGFASRDQPLENCLVIKLIFPAAAAIFAVAPVPAASQMLVVIIDQWTLETFTESGKTVGGQNNAVANVAFYFEPIKGLEINAVTRPSLGISAPTPFWRVGSYDVRIP